MKPVPATLMLGNAALFLFGALQHAGVAIGPFGEPRIIPASIVETLCAMGLIWGAAKILSESQKARRSALIGNAIAITGVAIGIVALAAGAGPRTASNDLYHKVMLALSAASILFLLIPAERRTRS
jgi:hypothetical protein